jgi:lantibiotic modifying enzyme
MYICEIPDCGRSVGLRSTLKTGDFKGKKVCPGCKQKYDKKVPKEVSSTVKKRKDLRQNLPFFFEKAILELKQKPFCENCGCKINVHFQPQNNIAHVLSKSTYPSVLNHPLNRLFLCSSKDSEGLFCHEQFDKSKSHRENLPVFLLAAERFSKFKDQVEEFGWERKQLESFLKE